MVRFAVIGGSSLTTFDPAGVFGPIGLEVLEGKDVHLENKHGKVTVKQFDLAKQGQSGVSHTLFFMQRHSHGGGAGIETGITPPHAINYHANVRALKDLQINFVIATTSVGTILPCFPPGRVGVARSYIDFTGHPTTFFHDDARFTSMTTPFDQKLNAQVLKSLRRVQKVEDKEQLEFVIWLSTGPQYETEAEVNAAERLGAECCGMTAPREAKLCAELAIPYVALTVSSNWAAGRHPGDPERKLNHKEVSETSASTTDTVIACLTDILQDGFSLAD